MDTVSHHSRPSRQSQMLMSPRRLDAIRKNGNNILSPKMATLNNTSAAAQYRENMETHKRKGSDRSHADQVSQMSKTSYLGHGFGMKKQVKGPEMFDKNDYEAMDIEI